MAVPTDDKKVRERLRAFGEPITLFAEGVSSATHFTRPKLMDSLETEEIG